MEEKQIELSIIIPAYNEAENLLILLPKFQEVLGDLNYELIVVDNASRDNTQNVLLDLEKKINRLKIVHEPVLDYGRAVRTGLRAARGRILGIHRSDNQEKSEDFVAMYEALKNSTVSVYKAIRKTRRGEHWRRVPISLVYNFLFRIVFGLRYKDINAVPKIFTREFYNAAKLESNDWFIDAEIVLKAVRLGYAIGEMRIDYFPRTKGKSAVRFSHIWQFVRNMAVWHGRSRRNTLVHHEYQNQRVL